MLDEAVIIKEAIDGNGVVLNSITYKDLREFAKDVSSHYESNGCSIQIGDGGTNFHPAVRISSGGSVVLIDCSTDIVEAYDLYTFIGEECIRSCRYQTLQDGSQCVGNKSCTMWVNIEDKFTDPFDHPRMNPLREMIAMWYYLHKLPEDDLKPLFFIFQ